MAFLQSEIKNSQFGYMHWIVSAKVLTVNELRA